MDVRIVKPTIYDIARATGVSIATVSQVLNNTGRIGADTRKKVLCAVEELGYEKSAIASALAGKNSHTIGFMLPDVNNPYYAEIVRGAEDAAFRRGYSMLICNTDHDKDKEQAYIRTLRNKGMDGIVIATGTADAETIRELTEHDDIKVVLLSRSIPGLSLGMVSVDNFQGGILACSHLLDLGHTNIGVITEPLSIGSASARLQGARAATGQRGGGVRLHVREGTGFGIETGMQLARELLGSEPVTALFATNDQMAVGALQACSELGKQVPEEISIVGFDDTILSRLVTPPLTTVAQPMYDLGWKAAETVIDAIESGIQTETQVVFQPELIVRASTARFVQAVS